MRRSWLDGNRYLCTAPPGGIHVYVPLKRGPTQKEVWTVAKTIAQQLARLEPARITAEDRIAKRPAGHVLVDYHQNAWGRTLASVYSVPPKPLATVSTPVTWAEVRQGIRLEDFRLETVPERLDRRGDLWKALHQPEGRVSLPAFVLDGEIAVLVRARFSFDDLLQRIHPAASRRCRGPTSVRGPQDGRSS